MRRRMRGRDTSGFVQIFQGLGAEEFPVIIYPFDDFADSRLKIYFRSPAKFFARLGRAEAQHIVLAEIFVIEHDVALKVLTRQLADESNDVGDAAPAILRGDVINLAVESIGGGPPCKLGDVSGVDKSPQGFAPAVQCDFLAQLEVDDGARDDAVKLLVDAVEVGRACEDNRKAVSLVQGEEVEVAGQFGSPVGGAGPVIVGLGEVYTGGSIDLRG